MKILQFLANGNNKKIVYFIEDSFTNTMLNDA